MNAVAPVPTFFGRHLAIAALAVLAMLAWLPAAQAVTYANVESK